MTAPQDVLGLARKELCSSLQSLLVLPENIHAKYKVIHDPIWGTCRFEPWESSLIDIPLFQRLRGLKQTGLAYLTYPAAEHSRFQHTIGVMTAASKIFTSLRDRFDEDAISQRYKPHRSDLKRYIVDEFPKTLAMLRIAALCHDLGHSILSHTSERFFTMVPPFPDLVSELENETMKRPGAAEVVVFLLLTSQKWQKLVQDLWGRCESENDPPDLSEEDWRTIGRWVLGYEPENRKRFLAEIISGPLDADKLDYISRDAYFAGIPVGHDYERFAAFVCVDKQGEGWRLTLPQKALNALEQLIMARLALTSYLYQHQKVRASEAQFERLLAREFQDSAKYFGYKTVWDLFSVEDAELYSREKIEASPGRRLLHRQLLVRHLEFREADLIERTTRARRGYQRLLALGNEGNWDEYQLLLKLENDIALDIGVSSDRIIVDVPRAPGYADLDSLELPGRGAEQGVPARTAFVYRDWIEAYKVQRAFVRVFAPKDTNTRTLFDVCRKHLAESFGMFIPESSQVR